MDHKLQSQTVLTRLVERLDETNEGWNVGVVDNMPRLTGFDERVLMGSWSWTMPKSKTRLLLSSAARQVGKYHVTPSAVTRAYLVDKYEGVRLRMTSSQAPLITPDRPHPLYAYPSILDDGLYFDVRSAFFSIVRAVGWDVDYCPAGWLAVRSDVEDYPFPEWKHARNCIVSLSRKADMNVWTGSKIQVVPKWNPLLNYSLVALVYDVLHGVASDMVRAGAVYVHTDGYIIPASKELDAVAIAQSWGLPWSVKSRGKMEVVCAGVYSTPTHKPQGHQQHARPMRADNLLSKSGNEWLRKRFERFSHRLNLTRNPG